MLNIPKIKQYIDKNRPYTQMPGYGMIDLNSYIPTDEEVLINMIEYTSYWSTKWMFEYMEKTDFCELYELYLKSCISVIKIRVKQYKHIVILLHVNSSINCISYNMNEIEDGGWYQELMDWCKTNKEGNMLLRKLKLDRVLSN
jgi:hypothetical protein